MGKSKTIENFPIDSIDTENKEYQFREDYNEKHVEDLAKLIKVDGQTDAIKLWKHEDGSYQILDGFHRTKAIGEILGKKTIEAKIYEDITEETAYRISATGNKQQLGYTDNELALVTNNTLLDHSIEETSDLLGMSEKLIHHNLFEAKILIKKFNRKIDRMGVSKLKVPSNNCTIRNRLSLQMKAFLLYTYIRECFIVYDAPNWNNNKITINNNKIIDSIEFYHDTLGSHVTTHSWEECFDHSVNRTINNLTQQLLISREKSESCSINTKRNVKHYYHITKEGKKIVEENFFKWMIQISKNEYFSKIVENEDSQIKLREEYHKNNPIEAPKHSKEYEERLRKEENLAILQKHKVA